MSENSPIDITDDQFKKEVLDRKGLSVVDFWTPTCGVCHQMAPALEAFAQANSEKVKVFKIDAEDNPQTAEKYNIRGVPIIIFFKDGEPVYSAGAMSQSALQAKLDELCG